jgi:transcriptional regulator with XRE-family HTH domain
MNEDGLKEFSERLIKVRQILGYNQKEFAPQINVSLSFLYQVEASRTKPGFNFFKTLIEKFNVNPKYLFTGDGEMFYEPPPTVEKPQVDYGAWSVLVDKLIKYIKVSPVVKFAVLEFFAKGTEEQGRCLTV